MVESSQREIDRALESSMQMFARVQLGEISAIEPRRPRSLLLALDGSSQDATSVELAATFHARFETEVAILAACDDATRVADDARHKLGYGTILPSTGANDSFQQILAACDSTGAELLVVPCPFGRDFEQVGPDSAGTVVDVLLARAPVPLLVVRQPHEVAAEPFGTVALALAGENHAARAAAAWSAGLVAPGGRVELVLVFEEDFSENAKALFESLDVDVEPDSEALEAALRKTHVRLHRALQKTAEQRGFDYALAVEREESADELLHRDLSDLALVVVPVERPDHASAEFATYRIRCARQPVLVVPEGAPPAA